MKFYSVKFILTIIIIAMSFYLVCSGKATAAEWFEFEQWILGLYILGNVGTKVTKNISIGVNNNGTKTN